MATAVGADRIDLSWTAPSDNGGDDITGYMIEYADYTGEAWHRSWDYLGSETTDSDRHYLQRRWR